MSATGPMRRFGMRIDTLALSALLVGCCFTAPSAGLQASPSPPSTTPLPTPVVMPAREPMPPPPASGAHVHIERSGPNEVRVVVVNGGVVEVVNVGLLGCSLDMPGTGTLAAMRCVDAGVEQTVRVSARERAVVVTRQPSGAEGEPIEIGRVPLGDAEVRFEHRPLGD